MQTVTFCTFVYLTQNNTHKMKPHKVIIITILFLALLQNVFGQSKSEYPFDVVKSSHGSKNIIFIPGFSCSGKVWSETLARYEKDHSCYTLTMAGFAGAAPRGEVTFNFWARGIAQYIKDNKIDKPIIIGHSMGGGLAMALAADHPALIGKIVVVDALPCLFAMMNPVFKSKENNDCSPMIKQMTAIDDEQFRKMQMGMMPRLLADSTMLETVVDWSVKSDRKTFAGMYCDFSNTDLRERIKTITCPSLIMLEPSFKEVSAAVEAQYKNMKPANLQYANKGLHFIMYDDRDWYFKQLGDFLSAK